jgi:hypothetical protein
MSASLLAAAAAEVALMWCFAFLAQRRSAIWSALASLGAFAGVAAVLEVLHVSIILSALVAVLSFALALVLWPRTLPTEHVFGKPRLALRLTVVAVFTVIVISFAGRLGASLSGMIDAIPLTSLMMAFFTRREMGADASSAFLRGVTKGSFSYVASMLVLAEMLRTGAVLEAFAMSLLAALLVQVVILSGTALAHLVRVASAQRAAATVTVTVTVTTDVDQPLELHVPGATTFKKIYESISA